MSPIEIEKPPNAKRLNIKRNTTYIANDLKLWKVSVVFHLRYPRKKAPMNSGANSRRAYFLYHGKSSVVALISR